MCHWLLQMQIDDPFTAVALKGVMEALMDQGTVIVCTSNSAPWDLNRHGVHEALFSQFTERLLKACTPVELSSKQDYRLAFASEVCRTPYIISLKWREISELPHSGHSAFV